MALHVVSARQTIELFADGAHERTQRLRAEVEADACGGEQLGQWTLPAQRQCRAIVRQRLARVLARLHPQLQRAELRNAVLDVVERDLEQVKLAVPLVALVVLEPAEVEVLAARTEAGAEAQPLVAALLSRVAGVGVDPVLVLVDRRDPRNSAMTFSKYVRLARAASVASG